MKSQNNEYEVVLNYFTRLTNNYGMFTEFNLLSIGENDGETLSNTYDLLNNKFDKMKWNGYLIEPSPKAFSKLKKLYEGREDVICYNVGIANESGKHRFIESGNHLGNDVALLSSLLDSETKRWTDTEFNEIEAEFLTFSDFIGLTMGNFHFITIDAEGYDYDILKQINLMSVDCRCLCIEHNGNTDLINKYLEHCKPMYELSRNAENIIFGL
jgi:FkbM family methyltransferase